LVISKRFEPLSETDSKANRVGYGALQFACNDVKKQEAQLSLGRAHRTGVPEDQQMIFVSRERAYAIAYNAQ